MKEPDEALCERCGVVYKCEHCPGCAQAQGSLESDVVQLAGWDQESS